MVAFDGEDGGEGAFAFHCVDSVFADVFDNPFKEVAVQWRYDWAVGQGGDELDLAWAPLLHI